MLGPVAGVARIADIAELAEEPPLDTAVAAALEAFEAVDTSTPRTLDTLLPCPPFDFHIVYKLPCCLSSAKSTSVCKATVLVNR